MDTVDKDAIAQLIDSISGADEPKIPKGRTDNDINADTAVFRELPRYQEDDRRREYDADSGRYEYQDEDPLDYRPDNKPDNNGQKDNGNKKGGNKEQKDSASDKEQDKEQKVTCNVKLVRRASHPNADGSYPAPSLIPFSALSPETVYKGGDVEFTFDDHTYKDKLIAKNKNLEPVLKELEKNGCPLPLASVIESNPELLFGKTDGKENVRSGFDNKAIADDARKIKRILSEAFVEFQRERYAHLNEEGVNDPQARSMALSVFMQKVPLLAESNARLQAMLQGSDEEKDVAAAMIMEAWSMAFAEYRTEIDRDIDEMSIEQLQKIADGYMKESQEQFRQARKGAGDMLIDYKNDLGFVFLGAFCPPLFIMAALPLILPFITAGMKRQKAYAEERKISGIYKKIDEKIEIATAATVSRGIVSDWITCNIKGMAPEFMYQMNNKEPDGYLNKLINRHIRVRDIITPLFKNNFDKQIVANSREHTVFEGECNQVKKMLEDEFKQPLLEIKSNPLNSYKKILKMITENLPEVPKKADNDDGTKKQVTEKTVSEKILDIIKPIADKTNMSIFDIYKGYTMDDFGTDTDNSTEIGSDKKKDNIYKGEASALSTEQLKEFVKYNYEHTFGDFSKQSNTGVTNALAEDGVTIEAVNLDMMLRSMTSYDTAMSRRNAHEPKSGLDVLDAAFGFEHEEPLKDKTFWSELEKTDEFGLIRKNIGDGGMDLLKRFMIASAMAESYNRQLDNIRNNGDEFFKLPGTAVIYNYYKAVTADLKNITNRLGDTNLSLLDSACSKITAKSMTDADGYDDIKKAEYDRLQDRSAAIASSCWQLEQEVKKTGAQQEKIKELEIMEGLKRDAAHDAKLFYSGNYDIYLANEISARTLQKYIGQARDWTYKMGSEDMDEKFNKMYFKGFNISGNKRDPNGREKTHNRKTTDNVKGADNGKDDNEQDSDNNNNKDKIEFDDAKLKEYVLKNYAPLSLVGNETSLTPANESMVLWGVQKGDSIDSIPDRMPNKILDIPDKIPDQDISMEI